MPDSSETFNAVVLLRPSGTFPGGTPPVSPYTTEDGSATYTNEDGSATYIRE